MTYQCFRLADSLANEPLIVPSNSVRHCQAISLREMEDRSALEEKLGRSLSKQERSRIGVSSLKLFLEELLQKRY